MFDGKFCFVVVVLEAGKGAEVYIIFAGVTIVKQERASWAASVCAHLFYPVVSPVSRMVLAYNGHSENMCGINIHNSSHI